MRVNFGEWLPDQPGVAGALVEARMSYPSKLVTGHCRHLLSGLVLPLRTLMQ
jgi:hypothetical protein